MRNFKVDRTQYPIGQGGFHHTRIHHWRNGEAFSVVYDCGGSSREHRKSLIDAFAGGQAVRHNWLVISHLDLDHINGVPQLLAAKQTFDNVILPHLSSEQREYHLQWIAFAALAQGRDLEDIQTGLEIVEGLYAGAYGKPMMIVASRDDSFDAPGSEGNVDTGEALSLPRIARNALDSAQAGKSLPDTTSFALAQIDWQFRFYAREWASARAQALWQLPVLQPLAQIIAKVRKTGTAGVASWKAKVNDLLSDSISKKECDAALHAVRAGQTAARAMTLKALIGALYKLTELEHYNSASLCLYSGPRERGNDFPRFCFTRQVHGLPAEENLRLQQTHLTRSVGWLGTGDFHFPDEASVIAFANHFATELPRVTTVVVPHHGSRHNYSKEGLGTLSSWMARLSRGVRLFLAPAKRSTYGHPHEEVEEVLRRSDVLKIVSESALTRIDETVATAWS